MKRFFIVLASIVALLGVLFFVFVMDGRLKEGSVYSLDIPKIRQLANSIDGEKPNNIQVEKVAQFYFPRTLSLAGSGFEIMPMGVYSFKLASNDSHVIVDTGYDSEMAASARADFYPTPYARMQSALESATSIVITHEHYDHIGGIVNSPNLDVLLPKLLLTQEQITSPDTIRPRFPTGILEKLTPIDFTDYKAIAPGVVLIKAAGHTPGSLMVYVQLTNSKELLFLGDIAWHEDSVKTPTLRPRLITEVFLKEEDRKILSAQLRFLNQLSQEHPEIYQVAGHDNKQIETFINQNLMLDRFQD